MPDNKASFIWAIKQQESGGDYNVVNSSSGALGAYQVMPSNVAEWTRQALGQSLSPQQYLSDPTAQDRVAETILGGYYDQYGARGAAAMWYSGQPDPNKTYGSPSVADYVADILNRMNQASPANGSVSTAPGGTVTQAGAVDNLANGLAQGVTSTFNAIFGPVIKFLAWSTLGLVGTGLMVVGTFLVMRETTPGSDIKNLVSGKSSSEDLTPPAVKPPKQRTTPRRKEGTRLKSSTVEHQTPEKVTEQRSFGGAHPSYGRPATVTRPPRRAQSKVVRKPPKTPAGAAVKAAKVVRKRKKSVKVARRNG